MNLLLTFLFGRFRFTFLTVIVGLGMFFGALIIVKHVKADPALSDAQKLEIRSAQLDVYNAKAALENTQQNQQLIAAQSHLTEVVNKVVKEAGVDPAKYQLMGDLTFHPLTPPPSRPPKGKEKK